MDFVYMNEIHTHQPRIRVGKSIEIRSVSAIY